MCPECVDFLIVNWSDGGPEEFSRSKCKLSLLMVFDVTPNYKFEVLDFYNFALPSPPMTPGSLSEAVWRCGKCQLVALEISL